MLNYSFSSNAALRLDQKRESVLRCLLVIIMIKVELSAKNVIDYVAYATHVGIIFGEGHDDVIFAHLKVLAGKGDA